MENLDRDLKKYRMEAFSKEGYEGKRTFDRELLELLRKQGSHSHGEILSYLNIN